MVWGSIRGLTFCLNLALFSPPSLNASQVLEITLTTTALWRIWPFGDFFRAGSKQRNIGTATPGYTIWLPPNSSDGWFRFQGEVLLFVGGGGNYFDFCIPNVPRTQQGFLMHTKNISKMTSSFSERPIFGPSRQRWIFFEKRLVYHILNSCQLSHTRCPKPRDCLKMANFFLCPGKFSIFDQSKSAEQVPKIVYLFHLGISNRVKNRSFWPSTVQIPPDHRGESGPPFPSLHQFLLVRERQG